jgi:hypothetical protein
MLKKAFSIVGLSSLAFTLFSSLPLTAFAGLCPSNQNGAKFSGLCTLKFGDDTFGTSITIIFIFAILLALAYLIWGGIKWVLSGGDKAKVDAARSAIVAAVVGLILVFLAYFIINIVVPIFVPGFSLQTIQLPSLNGSSGDFSNPGNPVGNERGCVDNFGTWENGTCVFH